MQEVRLFPGGGGEELLQQQESAVLLQQHAPGRRREELEEVENCRPTELASQLPHGGRREEEEEEEEEELEEEEPSSNNPGEQEQEQEDGNGTATTGSSSAPQHLDLEPLRPAEELRLSACPSAPTTFPPSRREDMQQPLKAPFPEEDEDCLLFGDSRAFSSPPSLGSANHAWGTCRPCVLAKTRGGCPQGQSCGFCHFLHTRRHRPRPPKPKRVLGLYLAKEIFKAERGGSQEALASASELFKKESSGDPQLSSYTLSVLTGLRTGQRWMNDSSPPPQCHTKAIHQSGGLDSRFASSSNNGSSSYPSGASQICSSFLSGSSGAGAELTPRVRQGYPVTTAPIPRRDEMIVASSSSRYSAACPGASRMAAPPLPHQIPSSWLAFGTQLAPPQQHHQSTGEQAAASQQQGSLPGWMRMQF